MTTLSDTEIILGATPNIAAAPAANLDAITATTPVRFVSQGGNINASVERNLHGSGQVAGYSDLALLIKQTTKCLGTHDRPTQAAAILKMEDGLYYAFILNHTGGYVWRQYTDYGRTTVRRGSAPCEYRTYDKRVVAVISGSGELLNNLGPKRWYHS